MLRRGHLSSLGMVQLQRRKQWAICAFFVAAVLHQLANFYYAPPFHPDKLNQLTAARSLLEGNGFTTPRADASDLSRAYDRVLGWPPGYSILAAAFAWVTGSILWSALLIDFLSTCVFFGSWYYILLRLRPVLSTSVLWAIAIFWGVFYAPLTGFKSSGALSVALLSASLALGLAAVGRRQPALWLTIGTAAFAGAAAYVHYQYWPLLVVAPCCFAMVAVRDRRYWWAVALCSMPAVFAVASYGGVSQDQAEQLGHPTLGLYWSNLLRITPFPIQGLGLHATLPGVTGGHPRFGLTYAVLWVVSFIVLGSVILGVRSLSLNLHDLQNGRQKAQLFFLAHGVLTCLVTLGLLLYQSLRYPAETAYWEVDGVWTYVQNMRYYAPMSAFILVIFAFSTFRLLKMRLCGRIFAAACLMVFVSAAGLLAYKNLNTYGTWRGGYLKKVEARTPHEVRIALREIDRNQPASTPVLYVDSDYEHLYWAALFGTTPLILRELSPRALGAAKEGTMFLVLPKDLPPGAEWARTVCQAQGIVIGETKKGTEVCKLSFGHASPPDDG